MSNEALLIYKKLGLIEESSFPIGATPTPTTKLLALRDNGIVLGLGHKIIMPGRISGRASLKQAILGTLAPKYTVPTFGYPTGLAVKIIKWALGQTSDVEVASFTVTTGVNDTIDFNIGAGNLVATVAGGIYPAGQTQADAGSLCKAVKDAITAAEGAGTYTVTYSRTTKIFTITRSAGTFQMKFSTGPNTAKTIAALLGFAVADQTGALTYSGSAVEHVFDHTITVLDAITYGLSAGITGQIALANGKVYDALDGVIDSLKFSYKPNQELFMDAVIEARQYQNSAASLSGLTEETTSPWLYSQLAFTVGGASRNLSELDIEFGNNYKKDLHINSQYRSKFVRNGFRSVKGNFTFEIADTNAFSIYDAMLAGTQPAIQGIWTQAANSIKTGFVYTLTMLLNKIQYNLADIPGGGGQAVPNAKIPFDALDDGTNGELKITVRNNEATI